MHLKNLEHRTMDLQQTLDEWKANLKLMVSGLINGASYSAHHKCCAKLSLAIDGSKKELEAIYHLTEAHGAGLRLLGLQERLHISKQHLNECISFVSEDNSGTGADGLLKRLQGLPSEWTLIQLTREFDPMESLTPRTGDKPVKMKNFHLTRMPCGPSETDVPLTVKCGWPKTYNRDPIDVFLDVKNKWRLAAGTAKYLNKIRKESSELAENYCTFLAKSCFNVWRVLLLGKLIDSDLSTEIRARLDYVLSRVSQQDRIEISARQRYLIYLMAEGSAFISLEEIELGVIEVFPESEALQEKVFKEIKAIQSCYTELPTAKRHSVILILDDQLDHIPWESAPPFNTHPYSRMPSVHFVQLAHSVHRSNIKHGFLEILDRETCFYVLNPENDLPSEKIRNFLKTHFPSWVGVINEPPTANQIVEALTTYKLYMYCGHGSGFQYMDSKMVIKMEKLQSVQFLIGCSSGALVDHGGDNEMTGDILQYIAAGSGCAVAILWSITNTDADEMTMQLIKSLLSTTEDNKSSLKTKTAPEPELLRAIACARKSANIFTNGAALVARGLPAKVFSTKTS